jgi:hypothetical protein
VIDTSLRPAVAPPELIPPRRQRSRRLLIAVATFTGLVVLATTALVVLDRAVPESGRTPVAAPPTPITYWPGPTTTGVRPGTVLRDSGSLNITTNGQVVSGLNVTGCITVRAANVRIVNTKITCDSTLYAIRTLSGTSNLVIEDVEINSMGKNSASVCCTDYTLRRGNLYNMVDGPRLGDNTALIDSYLHSLARIPLSHNDITQTTGGNNILVQHNRMEAYNPATRDPFNACVMIGSTTAPTLTNVLIVDNYCNGGNYSMGINGKITASNIVYRNNKFGRNYRYGVVASLYPGIVWESNNVWFDNGLPVR